MKWKWIASPWLNGLIGVPGLAYNIFIGAIILGMMALHSWLERRHNAGT